MCKDTSRGQKAPLAKCSTRGLAPRENLAISHKGAVPEASSNGVRHAEVCFLRAKNAPRRFLPLVDATAFM